MLPVLPFQTALAVALAMVLRGSKITAALGTWVSNPLNWYFLYFYSYKIGAHILGLAERNQAFSAIMKAIRSGEEGMVVAKMILGAGTGLVGGFLLGGFILGILAAGPAYGLSLLFFRRVQEWRRRRRKAGKWRGERVDTGR
jgi:hypothetical protein